ncbi:hypothetical protein A3I27_01650 [Candidatus Giovannonibacteria bacterium RIFCSPLOWO2_02_FULL_43_11b]|uniref:Uncharacterized protein n=1 Tax=Candidatus Giovannonibacteria bacterium RIFCSPHIGHO2_12_FULL_43_15 TaxID=1798341 RepID=A0A1F5WP28_9BACT|nr:MAG: hypothetical protein A2739_01125 [Candidatus Giovannonibacteria bacterium RIFCSPHIGHO2_01_FULL_43_100]OGF66460.1 MAG: hypothetical protein A3B97_03925 [Candidatus Giovannonibacteria bacterium RIFCSPHIGHO2_02_FULL_43_32]OGF77405.1 MAG: hypothetical protein A3F23_03710 [Candidatus Giovannonibacteria bacterium RIFCSPHIGHO2_12_FULL_43_15]OGF78431.1 MAG: hypothetical protein A3A15_03500 [Candidatus Giovannonibacteria bacterium RIFCSPLOWO2_01_FULL_43_60]OGF89790.1 MAG: hypothetical protein A3
METRHRKIFREGIRILLVFLLLTGLVVVFGLIGSPVLKARVFGVTYSSPFAEKFRMDSKEVYLAILDDLGARKIRLPVYWDRIEMRAGEFDFSELDWQVFEAQKRNAEIILTVGRKLPRWPECHQPSWVLEKKDQDFEKEKLLEFIGIVVDRYKDNSALFAWQIENEPFLPFGDTCLLFGKEFLDKEIVLVKKLDPAHPVIITDSGELSIWIRAAKRADIFGSTMYRQIWNENLGFFTYPIPPQFFRAKLTLTRLIAGERPVIISELQAEPWGPHQLYEENLFPLDSQLDKLDVEKFKEYISYAKKSGFDEFYLWGVEWWYWLKTQKNHPEIWSEAKKLF